MILLNPQSPVCFSPLVDVFILFLLLFHFFGLPLSIFVHNFPSYFAFPNIFDQANLERSYVTHYSNSPQSFPLLWMTHTINVEKTIAGI